MAVTCAEIFSAMPENFDAEEAGDWEAKIMYKVEGEGGGTWVMNIAGGALTITEGEIGDAGATVSTDAETWVGIAEGTVEPTTAFMTGKVRIEGNMADVMKAQKVVKRPEA